MTERRGGLGRGLAALIPSGPPARPAAEVDVVQSPMPEESGRKSADDGRGEQSAGVSRETSRRGGSSSETSVRTREPESDERERSASHDERSVNSAHVSRETDSSDYPDSRGQERGPQAAGASGQATSSEIGAVYRELPIEAIAPNSRQPRTVFDEEALAELEHSIREFGLMQPVVVREASGGPAGSFELIMGERRWRACQRVGLETIPAIIRQSHDDEMLRDALLENIHRVQLNPLEEASAYQQLLDEFAVTHDELADRIGRSRPVITNTIRLLRLPLAVQRRVAAGVLSAGHARALLSLESAADQEDLAAKIVAEGLSVRAAEEQVTLKKGEAPSKTRSRSATKHTHNSPVQGMATQISEQLSDRWDTRVRVESGKRKGRIVVEFGSAEDLERIAELMLGSR